LLLLCQQSAAKPPHSRGVITAGAERFMLVPNVGCFMTMIRGRHEDRQGPPPEVEGEIRELVRRDVAQLRKAPPEGGCELGVSNLNALIQRVSGTSVLEIEKLIAELQTLRDYLQNEGQRVQREITEYAHMSQAATKSTKIIAESLAQWKQSAESNRSARG
jgi:hypothetical protein